MQGTDLHLRNHWDTTLLIPVLAGTDGTALCLRYLASLPSCVKIEECQMSGFNTETLTVSCISTLIFLQIYSQFLSALFLLSTMVHDSSSVIRAGV